MAEHKVLILCTGNSARSQMSEGLINHFLGDEWEAYSAGTAPSGYVHPLAIRAMQDLDIDISRQHSKSVEQFRGQDFDLVVTVCDNARENCPVWLGEGQIVHIGFPDPAAATGTPEAQLETFREIRDAIQERVLGYLRAWEEHQDQPPEFVL